MELDELLDSGITHHEKGEFTRAESLYKQILGIAPSHAETLHLLGILKFQQGCSEEALSCLEKAVEADPSVARYRNSLGNVLLETGQLQAAAVELEKAYGLDPSFPPTNYNIARLKASCGDFEGAVQFFRRTLSLVPDHLEAVVGLAKSLAAQGKFSESVEIYEKGLASLGENLELLLGLGRTLAWKGELRKSESVFGRCIDKYPADPRAYTLLAGALASRLQYKAALEYLQQSLSLDPKNGEAHADMATILEAMGELEASVRHGRLALEHSPDLPEAASNYLLGLNYLPRISQEEFFGEHVRWGRNLKKRVPDAGFDFTARDLSPDRRLRIGYVSPDFREHSVAYFVYPLLENHSPEEVEVYCYSDVVKPDGFTGRFRALGYSWREIFGLPDEVVARKIFNDRIDILVDLTGHAGRNRLAVFARKPAPIQVTYLGYPSTTGLEEMDYRLVDAWTDPPGEPEESLYSERLVRLPCGFCCYGPPECSPPVTEPPCVRSGGVTFGSFNHLAKVNDEVIRTWAEILSAVETARITVKAKHLTDGEIRQRWLERFVRLGIPEDRLRLFGYEPGVENHLRRYNEIDMALDTFPYNGTTTTCEALWMGVPVLTLKGSRHAGRVGVSLLTRVGLSDFIATGKEEFVRKAVALSSETDQLLKLRLDLRNRMHRSVLMNGNRLAEDVETAFRKMWKDFCCCVA